MGSLEPIVSDLAFVDEAMNDPARVAAVHRALGVTLPLESVQERLVALADRVEAPFAAITLLDGSEQHFLATNGGPVESCSRDTSHCQYVIATGTFLAINDTQTSTMWKRFARNLVLGKPLQAYLGVPLRMDGEIVGAVCVVDTQPREEWTTDDQYECYRVSREIGEILERETRAA